MYVSIQTFTLTCVAGETGASYTARAQATSIITQEDADAKALGLAKALAVEFIECSFSDTPVTIYYSVAKTASVNNDPGYQTQTFTVTLPAGSIYSTVSQAAADSAAAAAAHYAAVEAKNLGQRPIFVNSVQSWFGSCPGYSVTITVPAGTVTSNISSSDASQAALASAKSQVNALIAIHCVTVYYSTLQSYTASCVMPLVGSPVTVTNPPGTHTSTVSQAAANAASLAAATAAATALLSCGSGFYNTSQSFTATCHNIYGDNWIGSDQTVTIPANTYFSAISQPDANNMALQAATEQAVARLSCVWGGGYQP